MQRHPSSCRLSLIGFFLRSVLVSHALLAITALVCVHPARAQPVLYASDDSNGTVAQFTPAGAGTVFADNILRTSGGLTLKSPWGLAFDGAANLYVADSNAGVIFRITPNRTITAISDPVIIGPQAIAVDSGGNIYVRCSVPGTLGHIARLPPSPGGSGTSGKILVTLPSGTVANFLAIDSGGTLYLSNGTQILSTPTGGTTGNLSTFTTIASGTFQGLAFDPSGVLNAIVQANFSGAGTLVKCPRNAPPVTFATLTLQNPGALAIDSAGTLYALSSTSGTLNAFTPSGIEFNVNPSTGYGRSLAIPPIAVPVITAQPLHQNVTAGATATFNVATTGIPTPTYQWRKNGVAIANATNTTLTLRNVQNGDVGSYSVVATNNTGTVTSAVATLALTSGVAGAPTLYITDRNDSVGKFTAAGVGGPFATANTGGSGIALDGSGTVYVSKGNGSTIVKLDANGVPSTFATAGPHSLSGIAFDSGGNLYAIDGLGDFSVGSIQQFTPAGVGRVFAYVAGGNLTGGLAFDSFGNLFVSTFSDMIYKITPAGIPSVFATRTTVGVLSGIRGLAFDSSGNLYVANSVSQSIAVITAAGVGSTFASALGGNPSMLAFDGSGNLYVTADLGKVIVIAPNGTVSSTLNTFPYAGFIAIQSSATAVPTITTQPQAQAVAGGANVTFSVTAAGSPAPTFQWQLNGTAIASATNATLTIGNVQSSNVGSYTVTVTNSVGSVSSNAATLAVGSRLINVSTRALVPANDSLIAGFVIRGSTAKSMLIRGIGPALATFGVAGVLAAPQLTVIPASSPVPVATNSNWGSSVILANAFGNVGAFGLPANSPNAAVLIALSPAAGGGYTAGVSSVTPGGTGVALVEVYDEDDATVPSRLINLSTRGFAGTGSNVLTVGFVVSGASAKQVLIRGIGPGLTQFGVPGVLTDPQLAVIPGGQSAAKFSNNGWGGDPVLAAAFAKAGAFSITTTSKDAALLASLPPGTYTAQVTGANATTGTALVEVYDLDP